MNMAVGWKVIEVEELGALDVIQRAAELDRNYQELKREAKERRLAKLRAWWCQGHKT